MRESSRYAVSMAGRVIYVLLWQSQCGECLVTMLKGDLFTRGLPGGASVKVCHACRPFEVDEKSIAVNWQGVTRHDPDYLEI